MTRLLLHVLFQVLVLAISLKSVSADDVHLKRFKLYLKDGKTVEGTNAVLTSEKLTGTSVEGSQVSFERDSIQALYNRRGSRIAEGLAIGMGIGALAGRLIHGDPSPEKSVFTTIGACSAGGALAGFLLGYLIKTWKEVPLEVELGFTPDRTTAGFALGFRF